jgi:uncharacterized protein
MRIVADTNVIVSALVFGGVPRLVFEMVEDDRCELYYSSEIQSETGRILRDKFGWDEEKLDRYLRTFWSLGTKVIPQGRVDAVREDPDDNRIIECALAADADVIVSGDKHLLKLGAYQGIAILAPRGFLSAHLG